LAFLTLLLVLLSCSQKVSVHELLGKKAITYRPVLVKNPHIDEALQKVAFERFQELLENPPLSVKLKRKLSLEEVVLVKKPPVEVKTFDFNLFEPYKDADLLVTMEIKELTYKERRFETQDDEDRTRLYCVERKAEAVVLFNVANPTTRDIYFAKTYKGKYKKRKCDAKGYRPELLPKEDYVKLKAIEDAVEAFVKDFYEVL